MLKILPLSTFLAASINAFLADGDGAAMVTPLLNVGVAGVMLLWFMFKTETRLKSMEESHVKSATLTQEALDRVARSNLLLVISTGLKPLQEQANSLSSELDEAQRKRDAHKQ
jgi:hypothetical protein